jgi:drug/metabolite transporter (DMT)-like permease
VTTGKVKTALLAALGSLSALLGYELGGAPGLAGAGVGILFAAALSSASHLVLCRMQKVDPKLLPFTTMLGVVMSFVFMAAFIAAVAAWRRDLLLSATLTALTLYLAHRFFEAFEVSRAQSARSAPGRAAAARGGER